jgi:hypothetical protein
LLHSGDMSNLRLLTMFARTYTRKETYIYRRSDTELGQERTRLNIGETFVTRERITQNPPLTLHLPEPIVMALFWMRHGAIMRDSMYVSGGNGPSASTGHGPVSSRTRLAAGTQRRRSAPKHSTQAAIPSPDTALGSKQNRPRPGRSATVSASLGSSGVSGLSAASKSKEGNSRTATVST